MCSGQNTAVRASAFVSEHAFSCWIGQKGVARKTVRNGRVVAATVRRTSRGVRHVGLVDVTVSLVRWKCGGGLAANDDAEPCERNTPFVEHMDVRHIISCLVFHVFPFFFSPVWSSLCLSFVFLVFLSCSSMFFRFRACHLVVLAPCSPLRFFYVPPFPLLDFSPSPSH